MFLHSLMTRTKQVMRHPPCRSQSLLAAATFSDEEWSLTQVEPPAANMRSSLAIAAAAAGVHRERDIEGEMDAIMGEAAHLKRRKVDDHILILWSTA
jgi:hypothetical protein